MVAVQGVVAELGGVYCPLAVCGAQVDANDEPEEVGQEMTRNCKLLDLFQRCNLYFVIILNSLIVIYNYNRKWGQSKEMY